MELSSVALMSDKELSSRLVWGLERDGTFSTGLSLNDFPCLWVSSLRVKVSTGLTKIGSSVVEGSESVAVTHGHTRDDGSG